MYEGGGHVPLVGFHEIGRFSPEDDASIDEQTSDEENFISELFFQYWKDI